MSKYLIRTIAGALVLSTSSACLALEPQLKPIVPKMDVMPKSEPLKGGIEHYVQPESKKKEKPTRLKTAAKKYGFNGLRRNGGLVGTDELNAGLDKSFLETQAQRGIGIIGVRFVAMEGYAPVINTVFPGTPAADHGVLPDDVIVAVDGVPTTGLTRDECYDLIVGTPNTPVTLSLRRNASFMVRTMKRMDFFDLTDPRVRRAYAGGL